MTLTTKVAYPASGGQRDYDVPFEYLDAAHVLVSMHGVAQAYEWIGPQRIRLRYPPPEGAVILIRRSTPTEPLVTFQNGAVLTEQDLNTAVRQALFVQQELSEAYEDAVGAAKVRLGENLGIPVSPSDIMDELVSMALATDVLEEFRRRIADIDLNAESIIEQALRTDALQTAVDALARLDDGSGIATVIQQERNERIEGDTALAETLALIGAKSGDSLSFILDTNRVRVTPTESLAARLSSIGSKLGENLALIQSEAQTRLTQDEALSGRLDTLGTRMGTAEAGIVEERKARSTADAAEAQARQQLAAKIAGDISAAVQTETNARVAADSAFASTLSLLGAKTADGSGWALDETKVKVAGGKSLGQRLSGLDTSIGNVANSVVEERIAWSTATSGLSKRIDGVVSTVGGHTTSITQLFEARDGLYARAGLVINNNGHITGWALNNDGRSGSMVVVADEFSIVAPNGGAPVKPFTITAGRARFNANVEIDGNLLVLGSINHGAIKQDTITRTATVYDNAAVTLSGRTPIRVQGLWLNVEKPDSPVELDFNVWATFTHNAGGSFIAYAQLVRSRGTEGQILCTVPIYGSGMANDTWQGSVPMKYLDRPGESGNWHYYLQMFTNVDNMTIQSVEARFGKATELKTNTVSLSNGTGRGVGTGPGGSAGSGGSGGGGTIDPGGGIGGGGWEEMPVYN